VFLKKDDANMVAHMEFAALWASRETLSPEVRAQLEALASNHRMAEPASEAGESTNSDKDKQVDALDSERERLTAALGATVRGIGAFERVKSATLLVYVLGPLVGFPIALLFVGVPGVALYAMGVTSVGKIGGFLGAMAIIAGLSVGMGLAANMLRKVKQIPNTFGVAVTDADIVFFAVSVSDQTIRFEPAIERWGRASSSAIGGEMELSTGPATAGANRQSVHGLAFLQNGKLMFRAKVVQLFLDKDTGRLMLRWGPDTRNTAAEVLADRSVGAA
jgi:hypothetical protein